MPVYEYRCNECGAREEHTHSMEKTFNPRCAQCGKWMRMVYSAPVIVYNGDGFAKKDRKKGAKNG